MANICGSVSKPIIVQPVSYTHLDVYKRQEFENTSRVLIAVGQLPPQSALWKVLKEFSEEMGVPVLGDIISNIPADDTFVRHHDVCLRPKNHEQLADLQPDLLITVGDSFISKNLKLFLRKFAPARHWHIKPTEQLIDTFQTL